MKKPNPPQSVDEVRAYVRDKNLCIDPDFFHQFFAEADWYDTRGNPVLNWKQKILTWHREQLERGKAHRCSNGSFGSCKKPGVYYIGRDRDGHPLFNCLDHKPKQRPSLPKELIDKVLKSVQDDNRDFNQKRNDSLKKLVYNEMAKRKKE